MNSPPKTPLQHQNKTIDDYKKQLVFLKKEYLKLRSEYESLEKVSKNQQEEIEKLKKQEIQKSTSIDLELEIEKELLEYSFLPEPEHYKITDLYKILDEDEIKIFKEDEQKIIQLDKEIEELLNKKK